MRQDELVSMLRREYEAMLRRWENGEFYYRLRFYMKHYAHKSWIRYARIKETAVSYTHLTLPTN